MKAAAALLAALAVCVPAGAARASCDSDGVVLFPRPGGVIPTNAELILEGRGTEAPRVTALVGKTLYLRGAGGETVPVDVRRGWTSSMARTAVRLVPKGTLKPDSRYTLMLESELPGFKNLDRRAAETTHWRIGPGPDKARPRLERGPAVAEGRHYTSGGRLVREVQLNVPVKDESPVYLVVTLRRARGDATVQTYFAPVDGNAAVLGHDGCSGGFVFDDGRAYTARVEAWDTAGNRVAAPKPVEFHAPRPVGR